jgi:hypothetical protein
MRRMALLAILGLACAVPADGSGVTRVQGDSQDLPAGEPHDHDESEPHDHDESEHRLAVFESVEVAERGDDLVGIASSASEGTTGLEQLSLRPRLRAGDLVETVPGAVATQHSGGGKANQYFLRGFNLDHGTDFAVTVGGMPVNMPSHGHGQGYADLNFLIPELVQRARYRKGPYFAEVGDFSSAGGVDFDLVRALPRSLIELTVGGFDYQRALWADSFAAAGGDLTSAVEYFHSDGPWQRGDDYERVNGYLGYRRGDALEGWSLTAMASDGEWLSTDQVPRRAVESGLIDRYGLLDPGPRGATSRFSLSGEVHRGAATSLTSASAYAVRYELDLISNFTYFLEDPVAGDQFEQVDRRWIYGAALIHRWTGHLGSRHAENAVGLTLRFDDIANGLYRTVELARAATTRQDDVRQLGGGIWGESWLRWTPELKLGLGLRADHYRADVTAVRPANTGSADAWILSPKASLVWRAAPPLEVYLNAGTGFHSNDARGATIRLDPVSGEPVERVDPLVRASGVDAGFRISAVGGYQGTVTLFSLELDSELLFVGDAGATEASRPSRRQGVEWTNYWQLNPALGIDFDVTWTDAEFTAGDAAGAEIPGAIETTVAAGPTVSEQGPWSGALRLRYFSGGPLVEDGSVTWGSTLIVNGRLGYRWNDRLGVALDGFNLLGREDDDIAYYYASRLPGEPAEGVEDVHFHPMERPSVRLSLTWRR